MLEPRLARPLDDLRDPSGRVRAFQDGQDVLARALHPVGDARETGLAQPVEVRLVHRLGVGLRGDLRARGEAELRVDGREDAAQIVRREQGGGAAAHEDGLHGQVHVAEDPTRHPDLGDGGGGVGVAARARPELRRRVGVEVAVPAARHAERDVHVESERPLPQPLRALAGSAPSAGTGSPSGSVEGTPQVCPAAGAAPSGQASPSLARSQSGMCSSARGKRSRSRA